jgi:WD40-like Beta Propeller Repeat
VPTAGAVMSPDGKSLLVASSPSDRWNLLRIPLDSPGVVHPYIAAAKNNFHSPAFSSDSKWVALTSDESGVDEVYIRSFPDPSAKIQVSTGGGGQPLWSADGGHLYYVVGATLLVARITTAPTLALIGRDTVLSNFASTGYTGGYFSPLYQPTRDGRRFLTLLPDRDEYKLVISPNWLTEFRKRIAESRGNK